MRRGKWIKRWSAAFLILFVLSSAGLAVTVAPVLRSDKGIVAAAHPLAAQAGAEILEKGGNAVDAAIAVSLALGVVEPYASGLGGEGYLVVQMKDGHRFALDFRSTAPKLATYENLEKSGMTLSDAAKTIKGACVPGVPAAIEYVYKEAATMKLEDIALPAIRFAEEGFEVNQTFAGIVADNFDRLQKSAPDFLNEGLPWEEGDIFKNPALAKTIQAFAKEGASLFYRGSIADKIDAYMKKNDGWIRKEDLEAYKVVKRDPLHGHYRGYDIYVPGMPVGGPRLLETLNVLEKFNLSALGWDDPLRLHIMQEAFILTAVDQQAYVGDPFFDPDLPEAGLLNKDYAKTRMMAIDLSQASEPETWKDLVGDPAYFENEESFSKTLLQMEFEKEEEKVAALRELVLESPSTTHFSIIDRWGNAVSWTQTISSFFGTACWVDGFFINNELGNFKSAPAPGDPIHMEPGKRPRTNIAPMIIEKDGEVKWVLGSPGASRIVSTLIQIIVDLADFDMSLEEAVKAPKFVGYISYPEIRMEKGYSEETIACLEKIFGHVVKLQEYPDLFFGGPNVVGVEEDGTLIGVGSVRRGGAAAAPEK